MGLGALALYMELDQELESKELRGHQGMCQLLRVRV